MNRISRSELYELFFTETKANPIHLHFKDRLYWAPSNRKVKDHIRDFDPGEFIPEQNDCDNKAVMLLAHCNGKGWPIATIDVGGHEMCVFVNKKKELMQIEPMTKEIRKLNRTIYHLYMP